MKPQLIDLDYKLFENFIIKNIDTDYFKNIHHFHKDYELVIILESSGKRIIGNHIESFDSKDVVFMGPDLSHAWFNDHEYYEDNEHLRAKSVVIYFKYKWIKEFILNLPGMDSSRLEECLKDAERGIKIKGKAGKRIHEIASNIEHSTGLKITIDILSILQEISEAKEIKLLAQPGYVNLYDTKDELRIQKVYEYVAQNFQDKIKLSEVAATAYMTPNAFCRYFKMRTRKNFSLFVNEIRVNHACKLLRVKDYSIAYISNQSGFNSLSNFNKFFKKTMKKSPREYRGEFYKRVDA